MAHSSEPHFSETDQLKSSVLVRFLIENVWLLALPVFGAIFFTIAKIMNSFDISSLIYPRTIQLAISALFTIGLLALPYRLFYPAFSQAKKEVEQLYNARAFVKLAKRALRTSASNPLSSSLQKLQSALRSGIGIQAASHAVEQALPKQKSSHSLKEYGGSFVIALGIALFVRAFLIGNYKIPSESMVPTLQIGDHLFVNQFIYGLRLPFTTWKIGTHIREPKRGEIIVFQSVETEDKDLIKRVIAIPGDVVDMKDDQLWINGKPLPRTDLKQDYPYFGYHEQSEKWTVEQARLYEEQNGEHTYNTLQVPDKLKGELPSVSFPYTVEKDHVFVMGDNRDNSHDGRYFRNAQGQFQAVPYGHIKGKAMFIWWSDGATLGKQGPQPWVRFERILKSIH